MNDKLVVVTEETAIPKLTKARALKLLAEAVAERGKDYKYRSPSGKPSGTCKYVDAGKPSCLVGLALHKHGVPIDTLIEFDQDFDELGSGVEIVLADKPWVTPKVLLLLTIAQEAQDGGYTWGMALDRARSA